MKKLIYVLFTVTLIGFTSCNKNKEVDVSYQMDLTINPADVIGCFKEYYDGDFDMYDGDMLKIHLFIYDVQGNLVAQQMELVKDYSEKISFSKLLPEGEYTVIASSNVYTPSSDFEYWSFSGENLLTELEIVDNNYIGYEDKILGLVLHKITLSEPINEVVDIKPGTALLEFHWQNVHYWNDVLMYSFFVEDKNDIASCNGNSFDYSVSTSGYYYTLNRINPNNFSSQNVYGFTALLPINRAEYWVGADTEMERIDFGNGIKTFEAGKQYNVTVNIDQLSVNISSVSQSSGPSKSSGEQLQKINVKQFITDNPQLIQKEKIQ